MNFTSNTNNEEEIQGEKTTSRSNGSTLKRFVKRFTSVTTAKRSNGSAAAEGRLSSTSSNTSINTRISSIAISNYNNSNTNISSNSNRNTNTNSNTNKMNKKTKKKKKRFSRLRARLEQQNNTQLDLQEAQKVFKSSDDFSIEQLSEELDKLTDSKIKKLREDFKRMKSLHHMGDFSGNIDKMLKDCENTEDLEEEQPCLMTTLKEHQSQEVYIEEALKWVQNEDFTPQTLSKLTPQAIQKSRRFFDLIDDDTDDEDPHNHNHHTYINQATQEEPDALKQNPKQLLQNEASFDELIVHPTRLAEKGAAGLQIFMSESSGNIDCDEHDNYASTSDLPSSCIQTNRISARDHRTKRDSIKLTKKDLTFLPQLVSVLKAERIKEWASRFRRADPRYQIMEYFDDVAKLGLNQVAKTKQVNAQKISPVLKIWNRSSIFTVWRPTSMEAIKHMMKGEGVGKGLDIKGKSAKKGNLSGFVPFLQIYESQHKTQIRTLPKDTTMRIFFQNKQLRDQAAKWMSKVGEDMIQGYEAAYDVLQDEDATDEEQEAAMGKFMWELQEPEIVILDEYREKCTYGVEVPERLFWEAYVMRQDIYREPESEYHTGRPSEPAFQDMNFASLRYKTKPGWPRPVVYQKDTLNALEPRNLLVAYEENDRVVPVVSDFDCFLTGTRSVSFEAPLPKDQVDLVNWSISKIESIMDGGPRSDSWTSQWLDVLKQDHRKPKMPPFGFGDPQSYSLMELAVKRLKKDGCVRHGAECFNFYFPQELDDYFLVIGEGINDNDNGPPWKYVDEEGLQKILLQKAKDGYTFPLNPKWILCDPGWKAIYDELLNSQAANVQDSLNCWFPPESGIREKIEDISKRFPEGFAPLRNFGQDSATSLNDSFTGADDTDLEEPEENDGTAAMDLAEEQLRKYETLQRAKKKLKIVIMWMSFAIKTNVAVNEKRTSNKSSKSIDLDFDTDKIGAEVTTGLRSSLNSGTTEDSVRTKEGQYILHLTTKVTSPRKRPQLKIRRDSAPLLLINNHIFPDPDGYSEQPRAKSYDCHLSENSLGLSSDNILEDGERESRQEEFREGQDSSNVGDALRASLRLLKDEIAEEPAELTDEE